MATHTSRLRRPQLVDLADERATDRSLVGAKAANLASAARAGLPVLPGMVLTTAWHPPQGRAAHPAGSAAPDAARVVWEALTALAPGPLVVRSSSTGEDGEESSMAGVFTSVLDVVDRTGFDDAVARVRASALGAAPDGRPSPMAVLVQPQLAPRWGGVLFGADPVSGRTDRLVVSAVEGGPDALVSGLDDGWTARLTPRGRLADRRTAGAALLPRQARRRLAALAAATAAAFGGPQDVEWAIDHDDTLWLLQSRPVTTPTGRGRGRVLGSGPLAETFPDPLAPLEVEMWLAPLGEGLEHALLLTGAASPRALRRSPAVRSVAGWAVADLGHLGVDAGRHPMLRRLDPRPPARRLRAAWRTGRLQRTLPALARDVIECVDADLTAVPPLDELSNPALLAVLENGRVALRALHGYEALAGMLIPARDDDVTAASLALSAVAEARAEGVDPEDLTERDPVVLALTTPRVGGHADPVPEPATRGAGTGPPTIASDERVAREALRLRARWVQELMARAAWELGQRLVRVGLLPAANAVRVLDLAELRAAVVARSVPADLADRRARAAVAPRSLPARFRLGDGDVPVAVTSARSRRGDGGVGAGGGVATGPVHIGDDPAPGDVLVVTHLDPRLAAVVPRLAGLVAETGSPLSHLAILAREHGVATVVGLDDAARRFAGTPRLEVDGTTGAVRPVVDLTAAAPDGAQTSPLPHDPVPAARGTAAPLGGGR